MGQQISRRVVGSFESGLQRARKQMDQQMRDNIKKNKNGFSDPNAVMGFTRGMDGAPQDPRDAMQEAFQKKEEKGNSTGDMPDDLLEFLNDVGPLERKVDPEFTSPRLRQSLQQQEDLEQRNQEGDSRRGVREMPIMGEEMDHVTRRTTNFATAAAEDVEEGDFGLTEVQMFEMLALQKSNIQMWTEGGGIDVAEKEMQVRLIESTRKYLDLPVIMKDKDKEFMGMHEDHVKSSDLFRLTLQPATGVKLVLSQLLDRTNEEKRRETAV